MSLPGRVTCPDLLPKGMKQEPYGKRTSVGESLWTFHLWDKRQRLRSLACRREALEGGQVAVLTAEAAGGEEADMFCVL